MPSARPITWPRCSKIKTKQLDRRLHSPRVALCPQKNCSDRILPISIVACRIRLGISETAHTHRLVLLVIVLLWEPMHMDKLASVASLHSWRKVIITVSTVGWMPALWSMILPSLRGRSHSMPALSRLETTMSNRRRQASSKKCCRSKGITRRQAQV